MKAANPGPKIDEASVEVTADAKMLENGKSTFLNTCSSCHRKDGGGDIGPNLTDNYWMHGNDIKSVFKTIRYGINAMPQWQNSYSNKEIAQVASFVKSLKGTNPPNQKAPQGIEVKEGESVKPTIDSNKTKDNKIAATQQNK